MLNNYFYCLGGNYPFCQSKYEEVQQFDPAKLSGKIAVMKITGEGSAFGQYRVARNLTRRHGALSVIIVTSNSKADKAVYSLMQRFGNRSASGFGKASETTSFYIAIKANAFKKILKADKIRSLANKAIEFKSEFSFTEM